MIERGVKSIVQDLVALESAAEWKDMHLADPSLKFKVSLENFKRIDTLSVVSFQWTQIVSKAMEAFPDRPISNVDLTNILTVHDLILTLSGQKGQAVAKHWNPWQSKDFVQEFLFDEQEKGSLPLNVAYIPHQSAKKTSEAVATEA
jgi:hypothetical protein